MTRCASLAATPPGASRPARCAPPPSFTGPTSSRARSLSRINDNVTVRVLREGKAQGISQTELVVGDVVELASGDHVPADGRLLAAVSQTGVEYGLERNAAAVERVWPFSSDEKHMTTLVREGVEALALVKGSPECVLEMCAMKPELRAKTEAAIADAQAHAYRALGFAHKYVEGGTPEGLSHDALETAMTLDGFVAIADPLRADVLDAISECRCAGISLKILTGDNIVTATAIAVELDIIDETHVAVEARDIVLLDDSFSTTLKAIRWGRGVYENFKRFISFQLTVNVASVIVVFVSVVLGLTFVLQVVMVQCAGAFFGTVPLPAELWARLFALAASVVALAELAKLGLRLARR